MRIHVIERNLAACGGRQQSMISGFADYFKSMGHTVKVYAGFEDGHIHKKERLLNYHLASHLTFDDFDFTKSLLADNVNCKTMDELGDCDVLMIPYPGFSWIGFYVECPIVSWYIAHPRRWHPDKVDVLWTNSETSREELNIDAEIVYPPHDYSAFRRASRPWCDREIDVLTVSPVSKRKEEKVVLRKELGQLQRLHNLGLNVVGLFLTRDKSEMHLLNNYSFEIYVNIRRRAVARFMGNSKILYHPSPLESCSLAVYESLNAGCYPVVRLAGACQEQLGTVGYTYTDPMNAKKHIFKVLENEYNVSESIERGLLFDRVNNDKIDSLLEKITQKNRVTEKHV